MTQDAVSPFKMNLPTGLKIHLTEEARRANRSLSGEIINRLQESCEIDLVEARKHAELLMVFTANDDHTVKHHVLELYRALGLERE